jgi:hypothetical protein
MESPVFYRNVATQTLGNHVNREPVREENWRTRIMMRKLLKRVREWWKRHRVASERRRYEALYDLESMSSTEDLWG